jgi:DNA-binding transcriptional MerR regulator
MLGSEEREPGVDLSGLCERAGVTPDLARELEEFGLLQPHVDGGEKRYAEGDVEIAAACGRLSRYGVTPRHLRTFRTAADRESALLEAVLAPGLRARNPERRQAALEDLQELGAAVQELSQLLFWRALRQLAST